MSRAREQARSAALPALQELVRLRRIKEELGILDKLLLPTEEEAKRSDALRAEYAAKKGPAWDAARAVFAPCGQCRRAWDHDCWYGACGRINERRW